MRAIMTSGPLTKANRAPEGAKLPRPNPIRPLGGPFRFWHLTPWKTTERTALMDELTGNLGEDDGETGGANAWDFLTNLTTQAGNVIGAGRGLTPYQPRPGQYLPAGTSYSPSSFGMSTNTLLLLGAAALGVVLLAKRK